jgi:hypothetical protein
MLLILFFIAACNNSTENNQQDGYLLSLLNSKQYLRLINELNARPQTTANLMMLVDAHSGAANIDIVNTINLIKVIDKFQFDSIDGTIKDIVDKTPVITASQYEHLLSAVDTYYKLEPTIRNSNKDLNFKYTVIYFYKLIQDIHKFSDERKQLIVANRTVKESFNILYTDFSAIAEDIFKIKILGEYSYKKLMTYSSKLEMSLVKILTKYNIDLQYPSNTEDFKDFMIKTIEINDQLALTIKTIIATTKDEYADGSDIQALLMKQVSLNSDSKSILEVLAKESKTELLTYLNTNQKTESKLITEFKTALKNGTDLFLNFELSEIILLVNNNENNMAIITSNL